MKKWETCRAQDHGPARKINRWHPGRLVRRFVWRTWRKGLRYEDVTVSSSDSISRESLYRQIHLSERRLRRAAGGPYHLWSTYWFLYQCLRLDWRIIICRNNDLAMTSRQGCQHVSKNICIISRERFTWKHFDLQTIYCNLRYARYKQKLIFI